MRALGVLALAGCCLLILVAPSAAQAPVNPQAAQMVGLRKELQRQRKVQVALNKELETARETIDDLTQKVTDQEAKLYLLRQEQARLWGGGAVAVCVLLLLLLIVDFRRLRFAPQPDELQQRLAALDHKLRELTPRGDAHK